MVQIAQQMRRELYIQEEIQIIDAHCHLDLFSSPQEAIRNAINDGIKLMVTSGGSAKSNAVTSHLSSGANVFGVVGIDPSAVHYDYSAIDNLVPLIKSNTNLVGIGEIGLDVKQTEHSDMEKQAEAFIKQIRIANDLGIPIVIHSRGAIQQVMDIVEKHCTTRAMFHFFEGTEKDAVRMAKAGHLISIPPGESSRRKRIINAISISNIVAETDSPVVGATPSDVKGVIEFVSKIKEIGFGEAAEVLSENIRSFFHI